MFFLYLFAYLFYKKCMRKIDVLSLVVYVPLMCYIIENNSTYMSYKNMKSFVIGGSTQP